MTRLFPFFTALLFIALSSAAHAQLTWKTKKIDLHPGPNAETAVVHFHFRNTGREPVRITNVTTSCPCTEAVADRTLYRPGESGEITATYMVPMVRDSTGKEIFVTVAGKKEPVTLELEIDFDDGAPAPK